MENYQKVMESILAQLPQEGDKPRLLLHSCCGPCSSYVLECLAAHFRVTVDYYNPNIFPEEEFEKRLSEQCRLLAEMPLPTKVELIADPYDEAEFLDAVKGLEAEPEGGKRCAVCYRLRLEHTAKRAAAEGFDFFTTTLTVSPYKHADVLNEIGKELAKTVGVPYLFSDFKKKDGYKRSCTLAAEYGLYRQDYCGCRFSLREDV
ncbi:MAG: epoxyqueuosine reductase QueH [Clostridia bacterium]|nr:epoxyqueuosine reductase QueH [Clostridia bacterium]